MFTDNPEKDMPTKRDDHADHDHEGAKPGEEKKDGAAPEGTKKM